MSADFSKILVKDDRLEVVDNIKYAVIKGGQNVTAAQYQAISATNSQLVFNIQVPSEQTLIDRRVMLQADFSLDVTSAVYAWTNATPPVLAARAPPASGCRYGQLASLAPYPLHQMMTVASATINNNTVSVNIRDVLPAIQRLLEERDLSSYNGMTPSYTDPLYSYTDSISSITNPLAAQYTSTDPDFNTRGSVALTAYANVTPVGVTTYKTERFSFHINEPLMISPFIYSNPKCNGQAFYGIQNMNIVLNLGDLSRTFRGLVGVNGIVNSDTFDKAITYSAGAIFPSPGGIITVGTAGASLPVITSVIPSPGTKGSMFDQVLLKFMFLTPHPSDLMPARNIVPFYELPRYITSNPSSSAIPTLVREATVNNNSVLTYSTTSGQMCVSQTLQLNQIPDKLIVFVRKQIGSQSYGDSDSYLPIRKVNINFNNNSGILASATCEDLYRMSKDNGSNQNWPQWLGVTNTVYVGGVDANVAGNVASGLTYQGTGAGVYNNFTSDVPAGFTSIPSCGSVMVLEFGHDIQLVEDFFAPGSLGNFNIQIQLTVENQMCLPAGNAAGQIPVEMVMITMNSGVFVCERGTSSTYTGILTRADVLEASDQDAYTRSDVQRLVGGSFHDLLKSGVSKLAPLIKAAAPHVLPHIAKYVKGKLGMGRSGGGPTGGGPTGGGIGMGIGSGMAGRYH